MFSAGNLILAMQIGVILVLICIALEFRRKELAYKLSIPEEQVATPQAQGTNEQALVRDITLWNTGTDPIFERDYFIPHGLKLAARDVDLLAVEVRQAQFAEPTDVHVELVEGKVLIAPLLLQHRDRLGLRVRLAGPSPAFVLSGSIKKVSTVREVSSSPAQLLLMQRCTLYIKAGSVIGTLLVGACFVKANVFRLPLPGSWEVYMYITLAYLLSVVLAFLGRRQLESGSSFTYPLVPAPVVASTDLNVPTNPDA